MNRRFLYRADIIELYAVLSIKIVRRFLHLASKKKTTDGIELRLCLVLSREGITESEGKPKRIHATTNRRIKKNHLFFV